MDSRLWPFTTCDSDRAGSRRLEAALATAIGVIVLGLPGVLAAQGPSPARRAVEFNRDVRPILAGNCFACHGLDDTKRKAGLRLDRRDEATRTTESGAVPIVSGKPDESELIARVFAEEADQIMPPPASQKTLTTQEKDVLRRWIAEGAEYKEHWAFQRPARPPLPAVRDRGWARNEIDSFVLARLEQAGLGPSPEAGRTTLIRRLSLDLIGLPPTLAEVDAFLAAPDPDAYEKVVDRLLASPHYGERWARRWLDRARYADTNGYEKDRERSIWPYRDWVINALNADMPFDQFSIEQIAGDLLPGATRSQRVATGFHRNTMINEEGGIDVEEFRFASLVDRIATTGNVWLGLTLQCAQCHTHKYDPITQREYYQLLAFFDNTDEPELELPGPGIQARRAEVEAKIASLEADLESQLPARDDATGWNVLEPSSITSAAGTTLTKQSDGSVVVSGAVPDSDTYTVVAETRLTDFAEIRLEALTDPSLPGTGPGRAPDGSFVLSEFQVTAAPVVGEEKPAPVEFDWIKEVGSPAGSGVRGAIDGDPKTGWGIADGASQPNKDRAATIALKSKVGFESGTRLTFILKQRHGGKQTLGRFRLSARGRAPEPPIEERSRHILAMLAAYEAQANPVRWTVLTPSRVVSKKQATMTVLEDRSVVVSGDKPNTDTYVVELPTDREKITALRLEVLPHPSLPDGGPGRAPLFSVGDFILTHLEVAAAPAPDPDLARAVALQDASQDYSEPRRPAALAIDDRPDTGWTVKGRIGQAHAAVFTFKEDVGDGRGTRLTLTMHQDGIHQMTIGRFRVSITCDARPVRASGLPTDVEEILLIPAAQRTEAQAGRIKRHYLSIAPELFRQNEAIAALRRAMPKYPTTMVMQEREPAHARTTHIHKRGEFLQPAEAVPPAVPAVLHRLPEGVPRDRLALARWLVAADNPLVGRVTMNQAWQAFFGHGLVGTVDNFGTRGDEPTHPELLDWLATELPRRGWSMKAMHRLIVTSATYRQSSLSTQELLARDPKNELLARGPRFRVDAELVRDIALSASGLLDLEIGGPSVYPPQPAGVTELAFGQAGWPTSTGSGRYRRGLYTFIKRTAPYAAFITFDAPSSETTCARRERSNTPLQALALLNDAVFVEASRALARRVLTQAPPSFNDRAGFAFRLCLSRPPRDDEQRMLAEFHDRQLLRFRSGDADAGKVAGSDPKQPGSHDPDELAAWTAIARVLLNLDETVTKE